MRETISELIKNACKTLSLDDVDFVLEHPNDPVNGDYATNVALIIAKKQGSNPQDLANQIKSEIEKSLPKNIEKVEVAGAGFINFYFSKTFFQESVIEVINQGIKCGMNDSLKGQIIMVEYTDPNPFKVLHIGHLMANIIGESIARLAEANGASVVRVCYQGDVGLHVAKALWGMKQNLIALPHDDMPLRDKSDFLGKAYAFGHQQYEDNQEAKDEIIEINKKLYNKSDNDLNALYEKGKAWSLDSFEVMYKSLGTSFVHYFFESQTVSDAINFVNQGLEKGVFEKSDGAIIYKGENKGLHTRVFVNQHGLPTYEAKELGLAKLKYNFLPDASKYITVTANEQKEYMKVVYAAMEDLLPEVHSKTEHITHGFLRLPTGKMSSRSGTVVAAEDLISSVVERVSEKMKESDLGELEKMMTSIIVAVSAVKYSILKQAIGKDIIFDFDKSISFEGDSGPYLQYAYIRAKSLLEKAEDQGIKFAQSTQSADWQTTQVERLIYQFSDVTKIAYEEKAPHKLVNYLTQLASAFNAFYAENKILDQNSNDAGYKLELVQAVKRIMQNGLVFLGIGLPERM